MGIPSKPSAVLLAGGRSSRMGREKPLLEIGGSSLIERVAVAVSPCVDEILLVTNRPEIYGFLGLPLVSDTYEGRGPLGGVHAGLTHVRSSSALVLACDYPFLDTKALSRIAKEDPMGGVVLPQVDGRLHPLCALYAVESVGAVEESLQRGELMVLSLVARLRQTVLDEEQFGGREAASRIFFNLNTPEDLRQAEALLAEAHPPR